MLPMSFNMSCRGRWLDATEPVNQYQEIVLDFRGRPPDVTVKVAVTVYQSRAFPSTWVRIQQNKPCPRGDDGLGHLGRRPSSRQGGGQSRYWSLAK